MYKEALRNVDFLKETLIVQVDQPRREGDKLPGMSARAAE
jgi:hypothetical protein